MFELFELRRVAVQTEVRRRKAMQNCLTPEQAMALMSAMAEAVRRHVMDRAALAAINATFAGLMWRDSAQALPRKGER